MSSRRTEFKIAESGAPTGQSSAEAPRGIAPGAECPANLSAPPRSSSPLCEQRSLRLSPNLAIRPSSNPPVQSYGAIAVSSPPRALVPAQGVHENSTGLSERIFFGSILPVGRQGPNQTQTSEPGRELGQVQVAIIGTGFAGLTAAIKLEQAGFHDVLLLERAQRVGGTWRDNHYPGAASDVPSHLYSLSFAPNPNWSATYPNQPELQAYLEDIVDKFRLRDRIHFNHNVTQVAYDPDTKRWRIDTSQGHFYAKYLWTCQGGLSQPKVPDFAGAASFQGAMFHSSQWNHELELTGKRIAVIGTGASAIQFVPEVAKLASRVDLYQRTPPWIIPRIERPYTPEEKDRFGRYNLARLAHRWRIYWTLEMRAGGLLGKERMLKVGEKVAIKHLHRQVKDPALRKDLTPSYTIGCKRILLSNTYYPTLTQEHVHLVTNPIEKITPSGIQTVDGTDRQADVMIFGTGFYTIDNPLLVSVRGKSGLSLQEVWRGGEKAYWGTMVPDFPNFFMIVGPNTGLGHNSQLFMIECQVNYAVKIMRAARSRKAKTVEVTSSATDRFDRKIQEKMKHTVWKSGCQSWYRSKQDPERVSAVWPGWTFQYWAGTQRVDTSAFDFSE